MTLESGKDVSLLLDDSGAVERDLSTFILALRANFTGHKLIDVTTMGNTGHRWASDELEDNTFEADFMFDPTTSTGVWAVLQSLRAYATPVDFVISPYGTTAGYVKISGTCFLENFPVEAVVGDMVKMSGATFRVDGVVAFGTN